MVTMNMQLQQQLKNYWDTGKFPSSWIISTDNPESALLQLKEFSHGILAVPNLPLENNPDFRILERGLNTAGNEAKYISVEQVRELQSFMNSTSSVSACKIAVIYEADLMNLNASNCCLKILEEAPRDSYIFLITSCPGNIIPTIKSRCLKVHVTLGGHCETSTTPRNNDSYFDFRATINSTSNVEKIKYIQEISGKDSKLLWGEFCDNAIRYLHEIRDIKKFDRAQKLINDATNFDLDKRQMGILIMECL